MRSASRLGSEMCLRLSLASVLFVAGCQSGDVSTNEVDGEGQDVSTAHVEKRTTEGSDDRLVTHSDVSAEPAKGPRPGPPRRDNAYDPYWGAATYLLDGSVEAVGEWRSNSSSGEFPWVTPPPAEGFESYITVTLAISDVLHPMYGSDVFTDTQSLTRYVVVGAHEQLLSEERAFLENLSSGDRVFAFLREYSRELYLEHPPETMLEDDYFSPMFESVRATVNALEAQNHNVGYGAYHEMFRIDEDQMYSAFSGTVGGDPVLSASVFLAQFDVLNFSDQPPDHDLGP